MEKTTGDVPLLLTLSFKRCPCCGEIKPTTGFSRHKNRHGKYGFHSWCKECENKRNRKYYKDNPEKRKTIDRNRNLKRKYGLTIAKEEIEQIQEYHEPEVIST